MPCGAMEKMRQKIYNLLRWSEKHFKTDMVYLAKGGFWLTLRHIISFFSSFLLTIAFANLLPKETFGVYKYVLSVCGILTIPTLGGINTAVIQAVARGYEGSLILALKTKIRWGMLGSLASLILAGYYYFQGNTTLAISFLIVAVFLPIMDSFAIYDSLLQGRKLFRISTRYGIISQIISVISLIGAIFFIKNLFLILLAYFAPWTILRFIFLKITLKKFQLNEQKDPQTISYGKHLSLMSILPAISQQIDKIFLFHYLGPAQLAIYSFAIAIPSQIKNPIKNLQVLILPKFSEKQTKEINKGIFDKSIRLFAFLSIITLAYILAAPFIFKVFFPNYIEAVFYSQIFSVSIPFLIVILPFSLLQAKLAKRELYQFNISKSIFQIIILFVLIYYLGIMGAIIAKILAEIYGFLALSFLIKKI